MYIENHNKLYTETRNTRLRIIGEETVAAMPEKPELTDAPTWFLDPIDGTINFVHNFPQFCISVGLTVCKEPVMGIIYNPATSELYSAIKGEGAYLNGKRIYTSKVTGNAHCD